MPKRKDTRLTITNAVVKILKKAKTALSLREVTKRYFELYPDERNLNDNSFFTRKETSIKTTIYRNRKKLRIVNKKTLKEHGLKSDEPLVFLTSWKNDLIQLPIITDIRINDDIEKVGKMETDTIHVGDNLQVMRNMPDESVHLIYTDPPYNSGVVYKDERGEFNDKWTATMLDKNALATIKKNHKAIYKILEFVAETKDVSMHSYLTFMAIRIIEMHRILKQDGSIYLHIDSTASHYLKLIMDAVFKRSNFRREIIVANNDCSGFKGQAPNWIRGSDTILYYAKSKDYTFHKQYDPRQVQSEKAYNKFDEEGRRYKLYKNKDGSERRSYWDPRGVPHSSVWTDIISFQTATNSPEYEKYPTQKPMELLRRIVSASSNKGDIVFDPFMGSGVALIVSRDLERKWIGCDLTQDSATLTKQRLSNKMMIVSPSLLSEEDDT